MSDVKFKAQSKYVERNRAKGNSRTTVWVPTEYLDEIKDVALLMRQGLWEPLTPDERPQLDNVSANRRQAQ